MSGAEDVHEDAPVEDAAVAEVPPVEDPSEEDAPVELEVEDAPREASPERVAHLARVVEAMLFLAPDPVPFADLRDAAEADDMELQDAITALRAAYAPGERGIELRELAGGFTLASAPETEDAARRLLAKPRTPPLTPAQAETLSIVAYLQPVSRPEIARIRGVSPDSAVQTLLERGVIEESGRSQFGAVQFRTTGLFLKLFGMKDLSELPDPAQWDPTPEEEAELRDRLLRAGEARAGGPPQLGDAPQVVASRGDDGDGDAPRLGDASSGEDAPGQDGPSGEDAPGQDGPSAEGTSTKPALQGPPPFGGPRPLS